MITAGKEMEQVRMAASASQSNIPVHPSKIGGDAQATAVINELNHSYT